MLRYLIGGCDVTDVNPTFYLGYQVENKSTHEIRLEGYFIGGTLFKSVDLGVNQKFTYSHSGKPDPAPPFARHDVDSIAIIFDNTHVIGYLCRSSDGKGCNVDRNILNPFQYALEKVNDRKFNSYYTLTDEDFAGAIKIE